MKDIIINLQESDAWKLQLTVGINFISSKKNAEEELVMHSMSRNMKLTRYNNGNEVVDKFFESLLSKYQGNLETSMKGKDFIFDWVQVLYYECPNVSFRRGGSYIDSPDCIKKKKNNKSSEQ